MKKIDTHTYIFIFSFFSLSLRNTERTKKKIKKKEIMTEITVICLEGIHGSGKTTAFNALKKEYTNNECTIVYLEEKFLPEGKSLFHAQDFVPEMEWMVYWFSRLKKICSPFYDGKEHRVLIIADRSPWSSYIYARSDAPFFIDTIAMMQKHFESKGIVIKTLCLQPDPEEVLARVLKRLKTEKWREKCGEESEEWFYEIMSKYEGWRKWTKVLKKNVCFESIKKSIKELLE